MGFIMDGILILMGQSDAKDSSFDQGLSIIVIHWYIVKYASVSENLFIVYGQNIGHIEHFLL